MKHSEDSEMNEGNAFYMIAWVGMMLVAAGLIWLYNFYFDND
jgi:hypothetical protein